MTTLGFGDIKVEPSSFWGHICIIVQVIIGYFMLGAIVTRFGVAFQSEGPPNRSRYVKTKKDSFSYWMSILVCTTMIIILSGIIIATVHC